MVDIKKEKFYLIGERDGRKLMLLESKSAKALEDIAKVMTKKQKSKGKEFKWEIVPGAQYERLAGLSAG